MSILKRADPTIVAPTGEIVVMKFDGSSIPSAGQLKVVAELVRDISTHKSPVVLLSGMGNTENNILQVLAKALMYEKDQKVGEYEEFSISQQLYLSTAREVELNILIVTGKLMFCMQVEEQEIDIVAKELATCKLQLEAKESVNKQANMKLEAQLKTM
ncbi:hypothetical protein D1007_56013 [Hordeum vulgare]|nr:hypothetical protein D1007_56013 [Hordeum vulgare]